MAGVAVLILVLAAPARSDIRAMILSGMLVLPTASCTPAPDGEDQEPARDTAELAAIS